MNFYSVLTKYMKIQYYTKQVYGKDTMYMKDEEIAEKIRRLTLQRTLTEHTKKALENLDFTFEEVLTPR